MTAIHLVDFILDLKQSKQEPDAAFAFKKKLQHKVIDRPCYLDKTCMY